MLIYYDIAFLCRRSMQAVSNVLAPPATPLLLLEYTGRTVLAHIMQQAIEENVEDY